MDLVMRRFWLLFLSLWMFASAAESGKKSFVIGVENINYYPYYDFSKGNERAFFTELIAAFSKASGYTFTYKPLPVKRLYAELLDSRQIDFKFPDNRLWGTDLKAGQELFYSAPVVEYTDGTMVLPENGKKGIKSIKVLGTIAGFSPWPYMEKINKKEIAESQNRTLAALLNTVLSGRTDGAYVNVAVANHLLQQMKMPGALLFNKNLPLDHNVYHMSTLNHPEVLEALDRFMKQNGPWIESLVVRYRIGERETQ